MLSIVIPTFNEMENRYVQKIFPRLATLHNTEVICVDHNSTDGTKEFAGAYFYTLVKSKSNSRAQRINEGIKKAKGDLVLIHHPRSILDTEAYNFLIENSKTLDHWGVFTHKFDKAHYLLDFTSWWSNKIRGDKRKIYYLDHCIFAPKAMLEQINYLDDVDIFEDTILCQKLAKICEPKRYHFISTTSPIRFVKNGIWKQAIINQILKIKFYLGFNLTKMNKSYEKNLNLNSEYKKGP